jgi:hypothetical protein
MWALGDAWQRERIEIAHALAGELAAEGYAIEQGTGKDGRYFEIAGVPKELIEAFSKRSHEVARAAERFRARYGRAPSAESFATSRWRTDAQRPSSRARTPIPLM